VRPASDPGEVARGASPGDTGRGAYQGEITPDADPGDTTPSASPGGIAHGANLRDVGRGGNLADPAGPTDLGARTRSADEALADLYTAEYASLVRLATLLIGDLGLAEEVVQDCFVALHQRWARLRDQGTGAAYLRRSVVNRCRSVQRHRAVVDRFLRRAQPRAMPSAESEAIDTDQYADVLAAVRALPARQREALVLRYYLDLSEAQTAEFMGISHGAVKSHTSRALAALRRVLESAP
jgi:RNA polymerase sigma-70 factor (sigma-E family)